MQLQDGSSMKAGFFKISLNPPLGTRMFGWGGRDEVQGCSAIHDDIYVRALWLEQGNEKALFMGFDLLFFSRDIADRLRGAISRKFGLESRQIMLNTSHTHAGPTTGTWYTAMFVEPDKLYLDLVEKAVLKAAEKAKESLREVSLSAGTAITDIMLRRRFPDGKGGVKWIPNPEGIYDTVPICLLKDTSGKPVCLLFSVSCHPATFYGYEVSADYPGVAMAALDQHLGVECSIFLQGVGADSNVKSFSNPNDFGRTWEDTQRGGELVAASIISALDNGLKPAVPSLACAETISDQPFVTLPSRAVLAEAAQVPDDAMKQMWAKRMIVKIDRGEELPTSAPITVHGIRLAEGVRLAGLEVEPVAEWGRVIQAFYGAGTTFALGYVDGCQMYLPTTKMLGEGGYEVVSYYEYHWPAQLAPGIEDRMLKALSLLREKGIC